MSQEYTYDEIKQHRSSKSCWLVIHGKVYDVTKFLDQHPGGEEVMLDASGRNATQDFEDVGHSVDALNIMPTYLIGTLNNDSTKTPQDTNQSNMASSSDSDSALKPKQLPKQENGWLSFAPLLIVLIAGVSSFFYLFSTPSEL